MALIGRDQLVHEVINIKLWREPFFLRSFCGGQRHQKRNSLTIRSNVRHVLLTTDRQTKPNQTQPNPTKPNRTEPNPKKKGNAAVTAAFSMTRTRHHECKKIKGDIFHSLATILFFFWVEPDLKRVRH